MEVDGTVERVEKFGVFVKLDAKDGKELGTAFMPGSESGAPRHADMNKAFPLGTKLALTVIDVDDRGRLKVSKNAREQAEERALVAQFSGGASAKGNKASGTGLGTFADLLKAKLK